MSHAHRKRKRGERARPARGETSRALLARGQNCQLCEHVAVAALSGYRVCAKHLALVDAIVASSRHATAMTIERTRVA